MDGLEAKMTQSLQFRLSLWLAVAILASALAAGSFSFAAAFHEANLIQDAQLHEVASLVTSRNVDEMAHGSARYVPTQEPEAKVVVERIPERDALQGTYFRVVQSLGDGIHTVTIGGLEWRVIVKTLEAGMRIAIGQQTRDRDEIARSSAAATLIPFIVLVPVLLAIVAVLVRRTFRPLARLAAELDNRNANDLSPVADTAGGRLPTEITPFVVANNRLLARVAHAVEVQRRFVADAAHELRSPLTALSLHAERLDAAELAAPARERLATLRQAIARTRALLEQLLTLARVQDVADARVGPVHVAAVFRQILEDLVPIAQARRLDIGVVGDAAAVVETSEPELATMLKNLVDNAIRYTPPGGRVDLSVRVEHGATSIFIDDTGPGIPESERERVFDRFYRVLGSGQSGSGLGLSIVQTIAARLGASVALGSAPWPSGASGLRVAVVFPATVQRRAARTQPLATSA
ncbi:MULTISPECIES: ATP-binding protein [unclassified Caballeronia]|uniref:ATP-binding protein n=1 Tax=unclassified Caballeronia TaxID=2646786 RepID=UPI0038578CBF